MAQLTPKKIYHRKSIVTKSECRTCGILTDNDHLVRLFSKVGKETYWLSCKILSNGQFSCDVRDIWDSKIKLEYLKSLGK